MYGSGLWLMEVMRLRVQDLDFHSLCINIWNAKGGKHRRVTLASELLQALREQIAYVQRCFLADCHPECIFLSRWLANTRMLRWSWAGTTCSRPAN